MRPPPLLEITKEEQEFLKLGTSREEFIQNPTWLDLEKYVNDVVEEALDQMRGNKSSNPVVAHRFKLVWQEREAFRDRLILFVKGPIRAKKDLLNQIEEEKKLYGRSAY